MSASRTNPSPVTHGAAAVGRVAGVVVRELVTHPDDRGRLFEVLRADDPHFSGFGQAYVTTTYPGVVKAWHRHQLQDDVFCCLVGMIKLVIHDARVGSSTPGSTQVIWLGEHKLRAVTVPKGCWHGWMCVSEKEAMILNLVSRAYDANHPDEERLPPHDNGVIGYDWTRRDG
jgi:dTDP-4-dehydrorhamnose 3,5-epimerase